MSEGFCKKCSNELHIAELIDFGYCGYCNPDKFKIWSKLQQKDDRYLEKMYEIYDYIKTILVYNKNINRNTIKSSFSYSEQIINQILTELCNIGMIKIELEFTNYYYSRM